MRSALLGGQGKYVVGILPPHLMLRVISPHRCITPGTDSMGEQTIAECTHVAATTDTGQS